MLLYERVRPTTLDGVAGHSRIKMQLERLRDVSGWMGQVFWFAGPSGTGKTTIGKIIAASVAVPIGITELDAQDVTKDVLRDVEYKCSFRPMGSRYDMERDCPLQAWCWLINESHGLRGDIVSKLQTLLENKQVQRNSTWIFTTTEAGQKRLFDRALDSCPFMSRAKTYTFKLDDDTQEAIVQHVAKVALDHNLNGKPLRDYWQLAMDCKFNVREMFQKVEQGCMLE